MDQEVGQRQTSDAATHDPNGRPLLGDRMRRAAEESLPQKDALTLLCCTRKATVL